MTELQNYIPFDRADTLAGIRRACGYITSDAKIAAFYGTSVSVVAQERAKLPKPRVSGKVNGVPELGYGGNEGATRQAATRGSDELNKRIWSLYETTAKARGITRYEAMAVLQLGAAA